MTSRLVVDLSAFNEVIDKPVNPFIAKIFAGKQKEELLVWKTNDRQVLIFTE